LRKQHPTMRQSAAPPTTETTYVQDLLAELRDHGYGRVVLLHAGGYPTS
jgi:hypothetical protein